MTLRDLLKKKEKVKHHNDEEKPTTPAVTAAAAAATSQDPEAEAPEFKFIRTTTTTEEIIRPPSFPDDHSPPPTPSRSSHDAHIHLPKRPSRFRQSQQERPPPVATPASRLAHRQRQLRQRPRRLARDTASKGAGGGEEAEAEWEKRATLLAKGNSMGMGTVEKAGGGGGVAAGRPRSASRSVSDAGGDENIQEAIRLHEAGDLERSTAMFGRLADLNGANNALSQVLYGLALRHGWGIPPNPTRAVTYLSAAASNSAEIEAQALSSGMKAGGAAKGELVLAIFELGNCFRHGWGVARDAVAARHYYETAANLGDTDALNEVAWCYTEGYGGKKDRFKAAQYLRLAEQKGVKTIGNTWIWKEKYNPK
ncbi:hypothetical protein BJ546DRAFT_1028574 [Cryomyces antarcticus]